MLRLRALACALLLFPLDLIVGATLVVSSFIASLLPRSAPRPAKVAAADEGSLTATILILNWDGKHLLEECLPSVMAAVESSSGKHQILVVDNGSREPVGERPPR